MDVADRSTPSFAASPHLAAPSPWTPEAGRVKHVEGESSQGSLHPFKITLLLPLLLLIKRPVVEGAGATSLCPKGLNTAISLLPPRGLFTQSRPCRAHTLHGLCRLKSLVEEGAGKEKGSRMGVVVSSLDTFGWASYAPYKPSKKRAAG